MTDTVKVEIKSPWYSKINWTQVVGMVAAAGTAFNIFELTPEQQASILATIVGLQGVLTIVLKTFFTNTITEQSKPPTAMTE